LRASVGSHKNRKSEYWEEREMRAGHNTSIEPGDLERAMREYVQAAVRLLAEVCPEAPPMVLRGLDEWKRDSDGIFRLYDREEPFWVRCIQLHEEQLHSLDGYHHLVAVLRGIPHIAQQLDELVGTAIGARRVETDDVADYLVWRLPRAAGGMRFDEAQFTQLLRNFEADLGRESLSFALIAPLLGLRVKTAPIRLAADIEIDNMTDEEIIRCLALGLFPSPWGPQRMATIESAAAVRVRYHMEKRVGAHDERQTEEASQIQRTVIDRAIEVLHALRVFKDGRVSIPGLLQFPLHWPVEGSTWFMYSNPGPMPWFNKYELSEGDAALFPDFWGRFQDVAAKGPLANAVRRFSYASDRDRDDDRLVDLLVAAESLFLADAGQPQYRGELRYRLALRSAFFIDQPEYTRRQLFKHMTRAYDVRSGIVHGGGEPDRDLLKGPTDAPLSLPEFTKVTEHLLRVAIKKGIDMAQTAGSPCVDWEALIMPNV